jgi:hypothetical protein
MRHALILLAACSNAADPVTDASLVRGDAPPTIDAMPDAPGGMLRIVVINEVAASEAPDWFEIVNATTAPIQLADFIFVDNKGDFAKAVAFPAQMLGPGAFATQDVDGVVVPFKLASDEELWVYRASDHALSDGVDWADGDSPAGGSFARIPDTFAPFVTTTHQTKGTPNQP